MGNYPVFAFGHTGHQSLIKLVGRDPAIAFVKVAGINAARLHRRCRTGKSNTKCLVERTDPNRQAMKIREGAPDFSDPPCQSLEPMCSAVRLPRSVIKAAATSLRMKRATILGTRMPVDTSQSVRSISRRTRSAQAPVAIFK
jgi:hypothetical protein